MTPILCDWPVDAVQLQTERLFSMKMHSRTWKVLAAALAIGVAGQQASATVLSIPFFSQRDPRWFNKTICCTVSMAMALSYRGAAVDPSTLIKWLKANKGYSPDHASGPVNWSIACNYQGRHWYTYMGQSKLPDLATLSNDINSGKVIISMSNRFHPHWVIIRGVSADGKTGYYWDPWDTTPTTRTIGDGWVDQGNTIEILQIP
jgi:uncharacterized protein YvpB